MGSREGHFEDKGLWTSEDGVSSECYNQRPCLRLQFVVGGGEGVWGEVTPFEKSALGEADALDRKPLARVPMTSMLLNGEGVIKGHANDYEMWNIINQLTWLKWGL